MVFIKPSFKSLHQEKTIKTNIFEIPQLVLKENKVSNKKQLFKRKRHGLLFSGSLSYPPKASQPSFSPGGQIIHSGEHQPVPFHPLIFFFPLPPLVVVFSLTLET
jgi:hypothetical protein